VKHSLLGLMLVLLACNQPSAADSASPPSAANTVETAANPALESEGVRRIPLRLKDQTLQVELALTPAEQQQGLMFRKSMEPNHGMLFVFHEEQTLGFWMRNTYLPLSIAYLNAERKIVDIQDMQPLSEQIHRSSQPAKYALEVNQGWFSTQQITLGTLAEFVLPEAAK
jgi:uncharacterized membrane protein (UPF0127 family)